MKPAQPVLLVDDLEEYLDTMEINLPEGCRAVRASSADAAKTLAQNERPVLAVVDIRLREDNAENQEGIDLLKWLRQSQPTLPVIMISAYKEFQFEAESLALGAHFFLKKPIQPEDFREKVAKALKLET